MVRTVWNEIVLPLVVICGLILIVLKLNEVLRIQREERALMVSIHSVIGDEVR